MSFRKLPENFMYISACEDMTDENMIVEVPETTVRTLSNVASRSSFELNSFRDFPRLPATVIRDSSSVKDTDYPCPTCSKSFRQKSHLTRHMKIHKKSLSSTIGAPTVASAPVVNQVALQSIAGPSNAPQPIIVLDSKQMVVASPTAQTSTSSDKHVCNICKKSFVQKSHLRRHMKGHSPDSIKFQCEVCEKEFSRNWNLKQHMMRHKEHPTSFDCPNCGKIFSRKDNMERHIATHFREYPCLQCTEGFSRHENLMRHYKVAHPKPLKRKQNPHLESARKRRNVKNESLDVFSTKYIFPSEHSAQDLKIFLEEIKVFVRDILVEELSVLKAIKWYIVSKMLFSRKTTDGCKEFATPFFRSKAVIELSEDLMDEHIVEACAKIETSFEEFMERGSGWVLEEIINLEVKMAKFQPLAPSSYIPSPPKLVAKKAVLNIQNEDNKCFIWSVLASLNSISCDNHPERVNHYVSKEQELLLGSVTCPVKPNQTPIIETLNNLRINVFGYEDDEVLPLYISKRTDDHCINLLYISTEEKQHYCLIRSMSRLLNLTKYNGESFYCYSCLHRFKKEDTLKKHIPYCNDHSPQRIIMPPEDDCLLEFTQHKFSLKVPYIIYADFEAIIEKNDVNSESTVKIANHIPCGYAYVIIGPDNLPVKPVSVYRGCDAVEHFICSIVREKENLAKKLTTIVPMAPLTSDEKKKCNETTHCNICKSPLGSDRVLDHDHITGKFRQVLHNKCNLALKMMKIIPCVFHNLKHYDAHLIMQGLGKLKDHDINVIPNTMEKYISFSINKKCEKFPVTLRFIDSLQFLNASLQKLVDNLERDKFAILKKSFSTSQTSDSHVNLLLKKGIYPYEYMSSFEKFNEMQLPPIEFFYSSLTGSAISEDEYQHAINVWNSFNIRTLGEYHDLYVKTDVLLLADVFQNFRQMALEFYNLDAAHMFTSPGFAWQAALKMTNVKLSLFTEYDMHLFIEKGIRGGVSMISHRYGKANNSKCPEYNANEELKHLIYLDANNLYGWAMSQPLPVDDFQWVSTDEISENDILNLSDDAPEGLILEVDLEYPASLHDKHNDYPLAPERMTLNIDMLSSTAKDLLSEISCKYTKCEKLIPNLMDKKKYVLHYRNLKLYLKLGLKLVKIHKILKFSQRAWLKEYIDFNTKHRSRATSEFLKNLFKLLNNAVFGKTMENLRNRVDVQIVNNERRAKKLVASPAFHAFTIFDENLSAVQRKVKSLKLNRPIQVGFTILELSKVKMYDFHYNVIQQKFGSNAQLLFTDTDSLAYEITTPDIYADFQTMGNHFDFSDYPIDHPLFNVNNKKALGFFKDELNGKAGVEFVGLRAKMYSLISESCIKQAAKGISRSKQHLKHANFMDCLFTHKSFVVPQVRIGSEKHQLYTIKQNKRALSAFDDKRYLLPDGITSYAYGHYKIT